MTGGRSMGCGGHGGDAVRGRGGDAADDCGGGLAGVVGGLHRSNRVPTPSLGLLEWLED